MDRSFFVVLLFYWGWGVGGGTRDGDRAREYTAPKCDCARCTQNGSGDDNEGESVAHTTAMCDRGKEAARRLGQRFVERGGGEEESCPQLSVTVQGDGLTR